MKRIALFVLSAILVLHLSVPGIVTAEESGLRLIAQTKSDGINPVSNSLDYKADYQDMVDVFEDGDMNAAWEKAQAVYEAMPTYEDIFRYYTYLRARIVLLPEGKYEEAYYSFSMLAGSNRVFHNSDGYALYAKGLQYEKDGDLENARAMMLEAFDHGVNEAASHISIIPVSNKSITLSLKNATTTSLSIEWADSNGSGPYQIRYYPSGSEISAKTKQVSARTYKIENLLPDTSYVVTVSKANMPSNSDSGTFATEMPRKVDYETAHSVKIYFYALDKEAVNRLGISGAVNSKPDKVIKLAEQGFSRGNRKPGETTNDYYARVRFSCDGDHKYSKETRVTFTYVFRSATSPSVAVGKKETVVMEAGTLNQSFYTDCLTDLMDLLYAAGGFDGEYFTIDVYMNNLFLGSQEIVINQR